MYCNYDVWQLAIENSAEVPDKTWLLMYKVYYVLMDKKRENS